LSEPVPLIELEGITLRYGKLEALRGITLRLPPGRTGLLGPNGAGKSSLLKVLMGLVPPTSGTGTVLGHDLSTAGPELRRRIGYMPEADGLVPGLTGVEYVTLAGELCGMPRRDAQRRAHELLSYLEMEDARYRKVEEYSLGMKQRIKLAQALAHDPPLLFLDEPTSGMDPAGRSAMLDLLARLGRDFKKSILLCTHLLGDVERVCQSVLILAGGRLLRQGSVRDLCAWRQNRYILRVEGDPSSFLEELALEGVRAHKENEAGLVRAEAPPGFSTRVFFILAESSGVTITGLTRDQDTLEEAFHRALAEADHA
jgi:ABC-2 type transport system ATP-binding protein